MKDLLLKFAGLFVERVPVEEPIRPPRPAGPRAGTGAAGHPGPGGTGGPVRTPGTPGAQPPGPQPSPALRGHFPSPSGTVAMPPQPGHAPPQQLPPVAVGLRAWVPHEYATLLAQYGLHVIAAGGELTGEQAAAYGAHVLIVSAECLGSHTHLLERPMLPTVFITPHATMIPEIPGVVQAQEPLRASEVASASRSAIASWQQARRQH